MGQAAIKRKQFTALNTVYLLLGFTGLVFFFVAAWQLNSSRLPRLAATPALAELVKTRHLMLLMVCIIEMGLGLYILQSPSKFTLFFQSLGFMLLLAAHVLFIVAFYDETTGAATLMQGAVYTTLVAVLLQLTVLAGRLPFQVKIVMKKD